MVLEYLYRLALEPEQYWWLHIGAEGPQSPPPVSVFMLNGYINGFVAAVRQAGIDATDYWRFRDWLRDDKKALPAQGWAYMYLGETAGDHGAAIRKFLGYGREYAALTKPRWFRELNTAPLPSLAFRGGEPAAKDVRLLEHVALASTMLPDEE